MARSRRAISTQTGLRDVLQVGHEHPPQRRVVRSVTVRSRAPSAPAASISPTACSGRSGYRRIAASTAARVVARLRFSAASITRRPGCACPAAPTGPAGLAGPAGSRRAAGACRRRPAVTRNRPSAASFVVVAVRRARRRRSQAGAYSRLTCRRLELVGPAVRPVPGNSSSTKPRPARSRSSARSPATAQRLDVVHRRGNNTTSYGPPRCSIRPPLRTTRTRGTAPPLRPPCPFHRSTSYLPHQRRGQRNPGRRPPSQHGGRAGRQHLLPPAMLTGRHRELTLIPP